MSDAIHFAQSFRHPPWPREIDQRHATDGADTHPQMQCQQTPTCMRPGAIVLAHVSVHSAQPRLRDVKRPWDDRPGRCAAERYGDGCCGPGELIGTGLICSGAVFGAGIGFGPITGLIWVTLAASCAPGGPATVTSLYTRA